MSHEPKDPDEFLRLEPGMPGGPSPKSFCMRCPERARLADELDEKQALFNGANNSLLAALDEAGALRARVRELEAADLAAGELLAQVHAAHTADRARLAAATAALDRCHGMLPHYARKALRDALAGQPAAPWRCQKCTGDHAASETCQPAAPPVAITQPAWSLPLRYDQPAAPSRFQGHPPFDQPAAPEKCGTCDDVLPVVRCSGCPKLKPAAPYYNQPRGKGGQIFAMSEPFEYQPTSSTRPPGDHGDRHHPDIAGYDPHCEYCVYTAPTRTEAFDKALAAEGMPDADVMQRYMLGRTEAERCPECNSHGYAAGCATCDGRAARDRARTEAPDPAAMRRADLEDEVDELRTRTEAERAVLDAMGDIPEQDLRAFLDSPPPSQRQAVYRSVVALCRAELARRRLKP